MANRVRLELEEKSTQLGERPHGERVALLAVRWKTVISSVSAGAIYAGWYVMCRYVASPRNNPCRNGEECRTRPTPGCYGVGRTICTALILEGQSQSVDKGHGTSARC